MAQRRFGPTLGAGVVVKEEDSDKPIQQAQLGVTAYMGILERGPINMMFLASKKKDFLAKAGGLIAESQLPDCAFDFYNLGQGAGELWLKRIVDGTQRDAEMTLLSRGAIKQAVLKITAAFGGKSNPGRWAGKKQVIVGTYSAVTANTLSTGKTMKLNEMKDALLRLSAVPGKSYKVLSNSTAGVLTFASDVNLVTDINGSMNQLYSVELTNDGRELAIMVIDGEDNPTEEFGLVAYLNGAEVKRYKNLSMNPDSPNYVEKAVNDDSGNYYFKVEDLFSGTLNASVRPANYYDKIKTVSATVLTADIHSVSSSSPVGGAQAVLSAVTYGGSIKRDTLTLVCTTAGATPVFSVTSAIQGALPALTGGTPYTTNEYSLNFTLDDAGPNFVLADTVTIEVDPFPVNGFVGGNLVPDYVNARRTKFQIVSNTVNSITVKTGSDMTSVGAVADQFMVEAPTSLGKGYDGVDGVNDSTFLAALDSSSCQFNSLFGKNKGLVKLAIPGVTATAVQKAGLAYAEARNYQFRVEIPASIIDESEAEKYINETIGRNDFGKVSFPSYAYVTNPVGQGLKLVSMTGAIHGREALVAKSYDGYHKVAAGVDVTLPNVVKLPTEEKVLDEELLNPAGINVLKFNKGNCIVWGARSISLDPAFRFVQKREQLSHYENVIRESFDYIIFALQSPSTKIKAKTSFIAYFSAEFAKGALSGKTFEDACSIKLDDENNTPLTESMGDLNAGISLRLADTVERFIITIGQAGIFESLAA